jgi:PKD repeat protein
MRKVVLLSMGFVLLCVFTVRAQEPCGTEVTPEQIQFMNKIHESAQTQLRVRSDFPLVEIPVKAHIVRNSNGTGGLSIADLEREMDRVNSLYASSNMTFFLDGPVNYINDDRYVNFNTTQENELANSRDFFGVINIYFFNSILSGSSPLCGYTRFPPSTDRIFMANACSTNGSTLAHEIGHYFTLYHTHGKTNTGTTDELVQRIDCHRLGDDICDTPADPNLTGRVNANCEYTGNLTDSNGQGFSPQVSNIMSYAPQNCRAIFTAGQYERIRNGFEFGRNYLNFRNPNFTARFSSNVQKGCLPLTVSFSDQTVGANGRIWTFEGGSPSSATNSNPTILYSAPGQYQVKLEVFNNEGKNDFILRNSFIIVEDPYEGLVANVVESEFESDMLPINWEIRNFGQTTTFQPSAIGKNENGGSIFIHHFDYQSNISGEIDDLQLPNIDLRGINKLDLSFTYAYTFQPDNFPDPPKYDSLQVLVESFCSGDFRSVWKMGGQQLATSTPRLTPFIPEFEEDWRTVSFSISRTNLSASTQDVGNVVFRSVSGLGNNLYIDNIRIVPDYSILAPSNLRVSNVSGANVTLRWVVNSVNHSTFQVERRLASSSNFETIAETTSNIFTDNLSGLDGVFEYRVLAKSINGTSNFSNSIQTPLIITSSPEALYADYIDVYPNPFDNSIVIKFADGIFNDENVFINIISPSGQNVYNKVFPFKGIQENPSLLVDLSNLKSGFYFIQFQQSNNIIYKKVIKK